MGLGVGLSYSFGSAFKNTINTRMQWWRVVLAYVAISDGVWCNFHENVFT